MTTLACVGIPKPVKRDRPNKVRKQEIKRKDIAFQKDRPERCVVPRCNRTPGKHHTVKRRIIKHRWDNSKAVGICWPHHTELESMLEKDFCEKYELPYPLPTLA